MRMEVYGQKYAEVRKHRNQLVIVIAVSALLNVILSALSFRLSNQYHIIITPPVIEEAFWIENRKVSSSYLQQMADYFSRLMLNATAVGSSVRTDAVLSLVDNLSYANFQHLLIEEEAKIKKDNFITIFNPIQYEVDVNQLAVKVVGDLSIFQGKEQVKESRKTYKIQFGFAGKAGKLLVKGFEDVT